MELPLLIVSAVRLGDSQAVGIALQALIDVFRRFLDRPIAPLIVSRVGLAAHPEERLPELLALLGLLLELLNVIFAVAGPEIACSALIVGNFHHIAQNGR